MASSNDNRKPRRAVAAKPVSKADALAMLQSAAHYAVGAGIRLRSRTQASEDGDTLVIVVRGARQVKCDDGLLRFELADSMPSQKGNELVPV